MNTIIKEQRNTTIKSDRLRHKGGRPRLKVRREKEMKIRLTPTEEFLIKAKAREAGMRSSSWLRAAAKNAKVTTRLKPEEMQLLRMLSGLANNLNQLTKLAHANGIVSIALKCANLLSEIDIAIKYFNHDGENS
ncbi:plasmid mobilization protein [Mucilaginibacter sp. SJ]|uniref:plasmid mobilization protein n=1 Tax=Mucilaginibacter sp. SJ TaxID=3029053 RepID=UPI0023A980D7|nr:plasmid mobilization relaxosome protein MobC [Mucilaginibacter sp. SJ]WEA01674.1 plasmid mobilization relaxosome protein MobC [Mucilaginibacter sp. SJ]